MKYPCDLIQDLLPLYLDKVCSDESKKAIETHLSECSVCKKYYKAMCEADGIEVSTHHTDRELKKAASFQSVKKKLHRKQILAILAAALILAIISIAFIGISKRTVKVVKYEDNISVSMVDGGLVGRLQGSQQTYVKSKLVATMVDGTEKNYMFFYMSDTKWDELTTSSNVFSEYTLCPADKGADQIDAVYYYTGEYTGIEDLDSKALQDVIGASVLLWEK